MSVLSKLTRANIRRNKKRSIVTMLGVALSVALLFTVVAIPTSFWETLKQFQISEYGDFYQSFEYIPGDKVSIIENAKGVDRVFYAPQLEYDENHAYLEGSTSLIPADYYERLDSLSDEQRVADKEYIVFVHYEGPLRKAGYAKPMHERYGNDIGAALEEAGVENYYVRTNNALLMFDGNVDYNTNTVFMSLAALCVGLVIIASIFTIRNSFNISTTERTREFGMLSSVGATPRQIRRSVVLEALIIGVFATPVGLLVGAIATNVLLGVTGHLLKAQTAMSFFVPWWAIAIVVVSGFIVVWLASASAAIRAGRLTPIDAIRSTQDVNIKSKKLKANKFVQNYFGIGGVIADKNLKRSRQKYRTTVISIVVSVAVFVGLSSFVIDGQRILESFFPDMGADYIVYGGTTEDYKELESKFDLGEHAYHQTAAAGRLRVELLSSEYFEKYARSVGIYSDFDQAVILNDYMEERHSNGSRSISRAMENKAGDELNLKVVDITKEDDYDGDDVVKRFSVKLSAVTDKKPIGTESIMMPTLFISENNVNRNVLIISDDMNALYANPGDRAKDITEYIAKMNERKAETGGVELQGFSLKESMEEMNNIILLLAIFMYGFIAVVALIGVTNIFNTITTNVQLRAKEFAMLKSVGMTDDEFNRMIRLESVLYTLRALLIGLPVGIVISYGVHMLLVNGGMNLAYELPLIPILISIAVVTLLITVIMRYSVRQVSRQNIIETIRQDTV